MALNFLLSVHPLPHIIQPIDSSNESWCTKRFQPWRRSGLFTQISGTMLIILAGRGGGRGGFQQRDMGPPDTVLGMSFDSTILSLPGY